MPFLLYRPFRGTGGSLLLPHAPLPIPFDEEGVGEVPQETWVHIKDHPEYVHLGFDVMETQTPQQEAAPEIETEEESLPSRGRGRPPKNKDA